MYKITFIDNYNRRTVLKTFPSNFEAARKYANRVLRNYRAATSTASVEYTKSFVMLEGSIAQMRICDRAYTSKF